MSLAARVGRAIAWGQAGRVAEAGVYFCFYIYLARVVGPASYGQFALGLSLAGACGFVALLGLGPETLGRFLPEISAASGRSGLRRSFAALLGIRLAAIAAVAVAVAAFKPVLAARLHFPLLEASFALVICIFAARSILDLAIYFTAGLLDLRRVAAAKLLVALLTAGLFVAFAFWVGASIRAAWLATALGSGAGILLLLIPFFPVRESASAQLAPVRTIPLGRILKFGIFAWVTNFFLYILGDNTDVLLLGSLLRDRAAIGTYAAAAKVVFSMTGLLLGWAVLVSVASLSEAWQREGDAMVASLLEAQWKLGVLCLVGPLLLVLRYAREILAILYSPVYEAGAPVIRILCGLMACSVALGFSLGTSALCATSRQRRACVLVGAAAAFNFAVEIPLVHWMGIEGAAWATGLSFVLLALSSTVAARRWIRWRAPCAFTMRVAAGAGLALVPTLWLPADSGLMLAAGTLVWGFAFLASLIWFKPLGEMDSASLGRISPRLGRMASWFTPREAESPGVAQSGAAS